MADHMVKELANVSFQLLSVDNTIYDLNTCKKLNPAKAQIIRNSDSRDPMYTNSIICVCVFDDSEQKLPDEFVHAMEPHGM